MASPIAERSISSTRYAMATAGTPESARPVSARSATNVVQFGEKEAASVAAAAATSEAVIIALRPSVRQRSGEDHRDRQYARRRGQGQARGGGRDRKGAGEERHQRLDAIEQREGGEAAEKQCEVTRQNRAPPRPIRGGSPAGLPVSRSWSSTSRAAAFPPAQDKGKSNSRAATRPRAFTTAGARPDVRRL